MYPDLPADAVRRPPPPYCWAATRDASPGQQQQQPPPLDPARLRQAQALGATVGLSASAVAEAERTGHRIYVLDNSGSTSIGDGKLMDPSGAARGCTRWDEITAMALDHAEWAGAIGVPAEFGLLNPRGEHAAGSFQSVVVGSAPGGAATAAHGQQMAELRRLLGTAGPGGYTPLAARLSEIKQRLPALVAALPQNRKQVHLVLVTDGEPTDGKERMLAELREIMTTFPVNLVVRLCSDDPGTVQFWNGLDAEVEFELDVLDDLWSEAEEVRAAGNAFLCYSPAVHRFREAGTTAKLFDALDERLLYPHEADRLMRIMLSSPDGNGALAVPALPAAGNSPAPAQTNAYIGAVHAVAVAQPWTIDPIAHELRPVIDTVALRSLLAGCSHPGVGDIASEAMRCGSRAVSDCCQHARQQASGLYNRVRCIDSGMVALAPVPAFLLAWLFTLFLGFWGTVRLGCVLLAIHQARACCPVAQPLRGPSAASFLFTVFFFGFWGALRLWLLVGAAAGFGRLLGCYTSARPRCGVGSGGNGAGWHGAAACGRGSC